jgi:hypothetical protein
VCLISHAHAPFISLFLSFTHTHTRTCTLLFGHSLLSLYIFSLLFIYPPPPLLVDIVSFASPLSMMHHCKLTFPVPDI